MKKRCEWSTSDPLYIDYHDNEWGRPVHDDKTLFEFLTLEGAQAGLSWITILKRREGYRKCFADFDAHKIARFTPKKIEKLLQDTSIIRNRLKVESTVSNAKAYLKMLDEDITLDEYFWNYVDGKPIINKWKTLKQVPANTPLSDQLSKDLKKRGFRFVGSTIMYAFMQATGMVNDHTTDCFCYKQCINITK
ncbi:MAG: DNA-3-methyladenine glycosylase I [Coxiellaceae bacterium]|nr:DNA-3-methyladenine glycosylase I [Coxiellaceae bacterium]